MQVFGTVIAVEHDVQVAKNGGGSYPGTRFSYRDEAGALKEKGMHSNTFKFNPNLKTQLSNLSAGQKFVMDMEKKGEFWNINSVLPDTGQGGATTPVEGATRVQATPSPKSTYETPDERAKKQVYIVRQSSITQAINVLSIGAKTLPATAAILDLASQFEAHVFGKEYDDGTIMGLPSDNLDIQ